VWALESAVHRAQAARNVPMPPETENDMTQATALQLSCPAAPAAPRGLAVYRIRRRPAPVSDNVKSAF
jgi:hypothetical protein